MSEISELLKARMEALAVHVPGIVSVITGEACKLDPLKLPAVEVRMTSADHSSPDADTLDTERICEWWVFARVINSVDDPAEILAAKNAALPFCDRIPRYLKLTAPRLELDGDEMDYVTRLGDITDSGPATSPYYDGVVYGVARIRIPILYS